MLTTLSLSRAHHPHWIADAPLSVILADLEYWQSSIHELEAVEAVQANDQGWQMVQHPYLGYDPIMHLQCVAE